MCDGHGAVVVPPKIVYLAGNATVAAESDGLLHHIAAGQLEDVVEHLKGVVLGYMFEENV